MLNFDRICGDNDCIELEFLEREAIPEPAMKLSIRLQLSRLSRSNTVSILDKVGIGVWVGVGVVRTLSTD